MGLEISNELIPNVEVGKWEKCFSVSLTGENNVPINKRGSGTRRLVLLNFFRAKAEEDGHLNKTPVIYGIEEPETSQHPNNQKMLLSAFEDLIEQGDCQVILTTHTPTLASRVNKDFLRFIQKNINNSPEILYGSEEKTLEKIKHSLGVLPDHNIKMFLGVEGPRDIDFLKEISSILNKFEPDIPNLKIEADKGSILFIPLGGNTLSVWANRLQNFDRFELYITDRDYSPPSQPKYQKEVDEWNKRSGCKAYITTKKELENYIHPEAIKKILPNYPGTGSDFEDVPELYAEASFNNPLKTWDQIKSNPEQLKKLTSKAKKQLNQKAICHMTPELLNFIDTSQEVRTWLRKVGEILNSEATSKPLSQEVSQYS